MDGFSADEEKRAERPAGERRLLKFSAFSKWMFLCHSNKKQHLRLYVQSLQNATSGGFLFFLPFFYKYIYLGIYII